MSNGHEVVEPYKPNLEHNLWKMSILGVKLNNSDGIVKNAGGTMCNAHKTTCNYETSMFVEP